MGVQIDPGVLPLLLKGKRMRAGLLLRVHTVLTRMTVPAPRALDLACALEFAPRRKPQSSTICWTADAVRRGAPAHHLTRGEGRAVLDVVGILALPYAPRRPVRLTVCGRCSRRAQQSMTRAWPGRCSSSRSSLRSNSTMRSSPGRPGAFFRLRQHGAP